jgi:hypothetical protein
MDTLTLLLLVVAIGGVAGGVSALSVMTWRELVRLVRRRAVRQLLKEVR